MYDSFIETVWEHYHAHGRKMPWRAEPTFYNVLVSEIMLQQTQVDRVRAKFEAFMQAFPSIEDLASAKLSEVLVAWQGLGYNRRAKFLHEAAKTVVQDAIPNTFNQLVKLPGVGKNTAGAIMNYAFNHPTPFVETNIRTAYFHHFFANTYEVSDAEILELVKATMDHENPREWFWALMDYGTWLKQQGFGRLDISKHYKKQSRLEGSIRQVRGQILKTLAQGEMTSRELKKTLSADKRYGLAHAGLLRDGLIIESDGHVRLTDS